MVQKLLFVILAAIAVLLSPSTARAADCATTLQATDGFKELSAKLKCLEDRIKTLEGGGGGHTMPGAPPSASTKSGARVSSGGVDIALDKCDRVNSNVYCTFLLANSTDDDKKVCFHHESRIVSDKGISFSGAMVQKVGAIQNTGGGSACDLIPPRVRATGFIQFIDATKGVDAKLQLVRLNCGGGCVLNAYDVPVE